MRPTLRTIVSIGFLTCGLTLACEESGSPADPMAKMDHARELVRLGKHEEALKDLLWCYDEGMKDHPEFVGVRVSFLPSQIAELGKTYPPALDALRERRNAAEALVKETGGAWNHSFALMELASLNHVLGNDAANLLLYDRLRAEQPGSPLLTFLQSVVADELVRVGRAEEAAPREVGEQESESRRGHGNRLERAWPREPDERVAQSRSSSSGPVYALDQDVFRQDLAASTDEQQRLEVLARRWDQVVLAVAHCDVIGDMMFSRSVRHWQSGFLATGTWTIHSAGDLVEAKEQTAPGAALVRGDCRADISFASASTFGRGSLVHIYGDLDANISVSGQSQVVIGGDITPNGSIDGNGIVRIFVGGDVEGRISNSGSMSVWINGDLNGEVLAGRPSSKLHVMGDFRGRMKPLAVASLAYLDVRGFMSTNDIRTTARRGWTVFNATIGRSDSPPGLYPKGQAAIGFWVVHTQVPKDGD
jgi:hypothetical protein